MVLTAALLASANAAHADYLWLQRGGDASAAPISAVARFGEIDETPQPVTALSAPRAFLADGKDLPLAAEADRFVDGTITLATPFPAIYVLEVSAKVNGAATIDGKKYEDVRHTATLSFEVMR